MMEYVKHVVAGMHDEKFVAVKINNYEISKAEFEQEFKDSGFGMVDTVQSRKDFLDNLVYRILIMQDSQKSGLDNGPQFLKMIEKFWINSLLKLALEKKSQEFAGASFVSDKTVEEAYQKMLKVYFRFFQPGAIRYSQGNRH